MLIKIKTDLAKVDGQVDLVVLGASRQGRTLPPPGAAVDGVLGWVPLVGVVLVAPVARLQQIAKFFMVNSSLIFFISLHKHDYIITFPKH